MASKPNVCPFCGSDDVMAEINTLEPDGLYCGHVICHGCEAEGPDGMSAPGGTWTDDHDEAVQFAYAAWNRRAAPPAAAHGDEAVRFESPEALAKALFDHGSIVTSRLVADRIFAAMRAHGDGEVQ